MKTTIHAVPTAVCGNIRQGIETRRQTSWWTNFRIRDWHISRVITRYWFIPRNQSIRWTFSSIEIHAFWTGGSEWRRSDVCKRQKTTTLKTRFLECALCVYIYMCVTRVSEYAKLYVPQTANFSFKVRLVSGWQRRKCPGITAWKHW